MAQQLQRAVDVRGPAQSDQDPIRAGAPKVDPRVAAKLVAELAHDLARESDVRLIVVAVTDLDPSQPQRLAVPAELRLTHGHAAQARAARHEVVEDAHALSASTTRRVDASTP